MPYKIAIIDDSIPDASANRQSLQRWASSRAVAIRVEHFASAERFLFRYAEDKEWDILLLDIEMANMDGISLAKRVRASDESVQLIFITGFPDFISQGYDVSALHYLMKPVCDDRLFTVLDRAVALIHKAQRSILLPLGSDTLRLPLSDVVYVEAFSHTCTIVTEKDSISVKLPISELEHLLGRDFVRCHRSYLVGLKHIARLSKTDVILDDTTALPLSRSAAPTVHKAFISYYTGEQNETV